MSRPYESGFHWEEFPDSYKLIAPSGKTAAIVFKHRDFLGHNWFVLDEHGTGGENSSEPTIADAMIEAEAATLRWGKHFRGD